MELKFDCKCTCGKELEEKNISVIIDEDCCEMAFIAKCPECGKQDFVSVPREMKLRIIHRRFNR